MKVMTIIGTRPEIIRLSKIIKLLDKNTDHCLVHTGQNYDKNLNDIFFSDLNLRLPNYQLNSKSSSVQEQISKIIQLTGDIMDKENPDCILILGDTNSGLSSISAKRKKIPIFHIEAGDRSFDNDVPEELNRRLIDLTSDINLAYSEHSRRNLINEGFKPNNIYVIGSPIAEVYMDIKQKYKKSNILEKLKVKSKKFFLISIHREENVDKKNSLKVLVNIFNKISEKYKLPIIVSTHPRTRIRLKSEKLFQKSNKLINWHEPFGLLDFLKLQIESKCVISDSGTIHEDSTVLGFKALAIRKSTEKKESLEAGYCPITGLSEKSVLSLLDLILKTKINKLKNPIPEAYNKLNVSHKVVSLILGLNDIIDEQTWGKKEDKFV